MCRETPIANLTRSRRIREQHQIFKKAMLSLRILLLIVAARAAERQVRQDQQGQYRYESIPARMTSSHHSLFPILWPYPYYTHNSLSSPSNHKQQWAIQRPKHQFQHLQTGNGNSLTETEIAMEILSKNLPPIEYDDVYNDGDNADDDGDEQTVPKDIYDFLRRQHNFRTTKDIEQANNLISKKSYWYGTPSSGDDVASLDALGTQRMQVNDSTEIGDDFQSIPKAVDNIVETTTTPPEGSHEVLSSNAGAKRNPLSMDHYGQIFTQPHYATAFHHNDDDDRSRKNNANLAKLRSSKRERTRTTRPTFVPSISAGALTHLGNFFNDLSKNVHFNEHNDLQDPETKLLEGNHPLRMLQNEINHADDETRIDKTAKFLQAIRTYRPSQKIRSLVSMNPQGYHGSNFLDPNYMWVGLG